MSRSRSPSFSACKNAQSLWHLFLDHDQEVEAYTHESQFNQDLGFPVKPDFLNEAGIIDEAKISDWISEQEEYKKAHDFDDVTSHKIEFQGKELTEG